MKNNSSQMANSLVPFLVVNNASKAIEFYKMAFGAIEQVRYGDAGDKITANILILDNEVWLGDEEPEYENLSPTTIGGSAVRLILTVDDPDVLFDAALKAGAKQICPMTNEEDWRIGKLADPFGHIWEIGTVLN